MRKLYTLPLSILGILFFFSSSSVLGQSSTVNATNDYFTLNVRMWTEDFFVSSNDTISPNAGTVSYSIIKQPKNVSLSFDEELGFFNFQVLATFIGRDTFKYAICDIDNDFCDTATVVLDITAAPRAKALQDDVFMNFQDKEIIFPTVNDIPVQGDDIDNYVMSLITIPKYGIVKRIDNNRIEYKPIKDFAGVDTFRYQICDEYDICSEGIISIKLDNRPPVAVDDYIQVQHNKEFSSNDIWQNDYDPNDDLLTGNYQIINVKTQATVNWDETGWLTYTPELNFNGKDTITYLACDAYLCDTGKIFVTVLPPANLVVRDMKFTFDKLKNKSNSLDLYAYITTNDINNLAFKILQQTKQGKIEMDVTVDVGFIKYNLINQNFIGKDTALYSVCSPNGVCDTAFMFVDVINSNTPPRASDDYFENISQQFNGSVFFNDTDTDNNIKDYRLLTNAKLGQIEFASTGVFFYTPKANQKGIDSVSYQVCDNFNLCDTANIIINVNTAIVVTNNSPIVRDTAFTIKINTQFNSSITKLVSDANNNLDTASFMLVNNPTTRGTITLNQFGNFTYLPNTGFTGFDSCYYKVCDKTGLCDTGKIVFIIVKNEAPIAVDDVFDMSGQNYLYGDVSLNDFDVDYNLDNFGYRIVKNAQKGFLEFGADGSFNYSPNTTSGIDTIQYSVCDALGFCDTAYLIIKIKTTGNGNNPPFAGWDAVTITQNTSIIVNWSLNDSDPDNDLNLNSFVIVKAPYHGVATANQNGTFQYTPNIGFTGIDTMTYRVCDLKNNCATATIYINVIRVNTNHPPVASSDYVTIFEDTPLSNSVASNATDIDGDLNPNSFTTIDAPLHGTIVLNPNGNYIYIPNSNFNSVDSVNYKVCDLGVPVFCDTASIIVTVISVNDAPIARDTTFTTNFNTPLSNSVKKLANDVDNNLDTASFTLIGTPKHGSMTLNQFGDFTYKPTTDFFGIDSVSYKVCDKGAPTFCGTGVIFIKVLNNNTSLSIIAQPLNIEECLGGSAALQVGIIGGNGVISYDWQQSADGINFTTIAGATMPSFVPFSTSLGATFYRCVVKAGTETVTSSSVMVNVNPSITFISQPVNIKLLYKSGTINADSNAVFKAAVMGGSGMMSYQWQCSSTNTTWTNLTDNTTTLGTKTTTLTLVKPKISEVPYFHLVASSTGSGCQAATSATGILTFGVITTANIKPDAVDDNFTTIQAVAINATVATNDVDAEGALNLTSFKVVKSPKNGNLTMFTNGSFSYVPATPFIGNDTASYSVCDVPGLCDTAFIFFKVTKGNHLPTITKDAFATKMNTALKGSVALNDTDFDNNLNKSSYKIITNPKNGNVKMWANGDILYLPKQNFIGKDTFYYQACDSLNLCGIAEAIVTTRGGFITGKIYYDANNNGAFDNGDLGVPNELVTFDTDGKAFTSSIGDFQIAADTSKSYVITPTLNNPLWTVNPLSKTVKTSNNFDQLIENQYFTVRPASQVSDLAINVEAGNARPGFSSVTTLTYYNKGTTVLNGKVTLTLDNNVVYESSDVALTQRSGNILTWSVVNLQPFESRNLMIFTKTNVSAPLNGNVVYAYEGTLTGATDADATNSKGTATIAIRGSYDPNDITVDRREYIRKATDATTPNVSLAYTIRFQNTGNAEAIRVEVLDTIQEKLDLTAFEMIAASHKFEVQIVPDTNKVKRTYTVVKWIFDNINLLDSTAKEACSHGFVKYQIKNISTKTNYVKDSILNKAAIYFDFNAPVLTNTATTKFSTLTVSSLEQYNLEFRAYPNPTNGLVNIELAHEADATIEVFNAVGQAVSRQILRGLNGQVDMSSFQTGFYILKIKTQKGSGSIKIHKE
jgi:hypothetical protein